MDGRRRHALERLALHQEGGRQAAEEVVLDVYAPTDLLELPCEVGVVLPFWHEAFGEEEVGGVQRRERIEEPALVWHALCRGHDAPGAVQITLLDLPV